MRWGEIHKGVTVHEPEIRERCSMIAMALQAMGPITVQCLLAFRPGPIPVRHKTRAKARDYSPGLQPGTTARDYEKPSRNGFVARSRPTVVVPPWPG